MNLTVHCSCGRLLRVKHDLAGHTVRCPKCHQPLTIPGAPHQAPRSPDEQITRTVNPPIPSADDGSGKPSTSAGSPKPPSYDTPQPPAQIVDPPPQPRPRTAASGSPAPPPLPSQTAPPPAPRWQLAPRPLGSPPPIPVPPSQQAEPFKAAVIVPPRPSRRPASTAAQKWWQSTVGRVIWNAPDGGLPVAAIPADRRRATYHLALALACAAIFGMFPALWQIAAALGEGKPDAIAAWALCLVLIGLLQLAYAAYLAQLPDWSSVWVVTVMMLVMTTLYAMLMALSWLSNGQHRLLLLLDLSGLVISNKVTGWSFIMVSICALYAYFSGQCTSAWRARS